LAALRCRPHPAQPLRALVHHLPFLDGVAVVAAVVLFGARTHATEGGDLLALPLRELARLFARRAEHPSRDVVADGRQLAAEFRRRAARAPLGDALRLRRAPLPVKLYQQLL